MFRDADVAAIDGVKGRCCCSSHRGKVNCLRGLRRSGGDEWRQENRRVSPKAGTMHRASLVPSSPGYAQERGRKTKVCCGCARLSSANARLALAVSGRLCWWQGADHHTRMDVFGAAAQFWAPLTSREINELNATRMWSGGYSFLATIKNLKWECFGCRRDETLAGCKAVVGSVRWQNWKRMKGSSQGSPWALLPWAVA